MSTLFQDEPEMTAKQLRKFKSKSWSRYTIEREGEQFRIVWHPRKVCRVEPQPCGLFETIETARKSLPRLTLVPSEFRRHQDSIEEYA